MNWSERTVGNNIEVDKFNISDILEYYVNDDFYVNRKYQRKLVWGLEDKRKLIESILMGIPLPALIIARYDIPGRKTSILEIVDGLQRLNAIISFFLGEFAIEYNNKQCYFNNSKSQIGYELICDGKLIPPDEESVLPEDICKEFLKYKIPVILTNKDNSTIELIFSRINSTGRKMSSQDIRQSVSVCEFADLVRRVASRLRQDYTYEDRVCLCDMPKISVGYEKCGYGVKLETLFWRRHDVLTASGLKESSDEEFIETLIASALLPDFRRSKDNLDALYNETTRLGSQIDAKIKEVGKDNLENTFAHVFDVIDMIFESVNSDFSSYLFDVKKTRNKAECFEVLALALYRLLECHYTISNYKRVAEAIKGSSGILYAFTNNERIDYSSISSSADALCGIMKQYCSYVVPPTDSAIVEEIDRRLTLSKVERQMTEFKIGISNFGLNVINENVVHDIARTLVAMANTHNVNECGLLIIGIANNLKQYNDWSAIYKTPAVVQNQHYITGITDEAKKLCEDSDGYYRRVRRLINAEPISEKLKDFILQNFEIIDYYDKELMIFRSQDVGETSTYDEKKYIRYASETLPVSSN